MRSLVHTPFLRNLSRLKYTVRYASLRSPDIKGEDYLATSSFISSLHIHGRCFFDSSPTERDDMA